MPLAMTINDYNAVENLKHPDKTQCPCVTPVLSLANAIEI